MILNSRIYYSLNPCEQSSFKKRFLKLLDKNQFEIFLECYGSESKEDFFTWLDWIKDKQNELKSK